MNKPLRDLMPGTAQLIDDLRDALGAEMVNDAIRGAMAGQPLFHAVEGGRTFGTPPKAPGDPVKLSETLVGPMRLRKNAKGQRGAACGASAAPTGCA